MAIIAALRRRDVLALILTLSLFIFTFSIFSQPTQIISTTLAWPRVESLASPAQVFESVYIDETDLETPFESEPGPESEFESELEPLEVLAQIYEDERIALLAETTKPPPSLSSGAQLVHSILISGLTFPASRGS